ncbi:MAG: hypothetical protein NVSMB38_13250 [Ktedonobacteraceae bacterium]
MARTRCTDPIGKSRYRESLDRIAGPGDLETMKHIQAAAAIEAQSQNGVVT